jgi:NADPH:quinone reductase-like Zn-dependent oxidoreductase
MSSLPVKTEKRRKASSNSIPDRMQAVRLHLAGGPVGLKNEEIDTPRPGAAEVLVRVHAAAITRDELDWPVNRLPAIPSYEFSGVVAEFGNAADAFTIGQAVYALSPFDRDGAAAEYVAVPVQCLAPKPTNLSHVEAASIPLAALTAWQGLLEHGQLVKGQRVVIHGATGGVGNFAVQLARLHGAYVIGTVSSGNVELARTMGLDQVIDYTRTPFEKAVGEVDLVFDTAGGQRLERSAAVVRRGGRLVSVATEPSQEQAAERGITAIYFVVKPNGDELAQITKLVEDGSLTPMLDQVFPLAQARQAFARSLSHHAPGKIVLQVASG